MRKFFLLFSLLFAILSNSQETKKNIRSVRISKAPVIDGVLNDDAWVNADVAKDFVMFRPSSGTPERENQKTEVRVRPFILVLIYTMTNLKRSLNNLQIVIILEHATGLAL